jgi:hypothetical protein
MNELKAPEAVATAVIMIHRATGAESINQGA